MARTTTQDSWHLLTIEFTQPRKDNDNARIIPPLAFRLVPDAPRADDRDSRAADGDLGYRLARATPRKRALMTAMFLEFAAVLVLVLAAVFAWLSAQLPKETDDG